jgi:hypothetical protein
LGQRLNGDRAGSSFRPFGCEPSVKTDIDGIVVSMKSFENLRWREALIQSDVQLKLGQPGDLVLNDLTGQKRLVDFQETTSELIGGFEQGHVISFAQEVPGDRQTAEAASQDSHFLIPAGEDLRSLFKACGHDAGPFKGADLNGIPGLASEAFRLAGCIADPAKYAWERHGLVQDFESPDPVTTADAAGESPRVHVQGACGGALRCVFLDASVFQLSQVMLVHGAGLPEKNVKQRRTKGKTLEFASALFPVGRRSGMDSRVTTSGP